MSVSKVARDRLLLALGTFPEIDEADFALCVLLEIAQVEAENLTDDPQALDIAHQCRLRALRTFVEEYMHVEWRKTDEDRAVAGAPTAAETGLRVVPDGAP